MKFGKLLRPVLLVLLTMLLTSCGYNEMQRQEEAVFKAWGDVESALQRRADLIPNLVETVKGFAKQEQQVLTQVVEARAKATSVNIKADDLSDPGKLAALQGAQGQLSSALGRLMVVVEKYPELKSNQNFMDLQHQLEGTENRINVARQRYNEAVEQFNSSIRGLPNSLTNGLLLHLKPKEYFKAAESAQQAPKVAF